MTNPLDDHLLQKSETPAFKARPAIIWGIILAIGIFSRLMHWPSATIILFSSAGLTAYAISGLITFKGRNRPNLILSIAGMAWTLVLVGTVLFHSVLLFNVKGLYIFLGVFVVCFIGYELQKRGQRRARKKRDSNIG